MIKRIISSLLPALVVICIALPLWTQENKGGNTQIEKKPELLTVTEKIPVSDGIINTDEYSLTLPLKKFTVHLSRTADTLYFALTADTKGWIAMGFGSTKMNNAHILMGYYKDKKSAVVEQLGSGKSHKDTDTKLLKNSALSETDGKTVFEGELISEKLITKDQAQLDFILAYGNADNFFSFHTAKEAYTVKLK